MGSNQLREAVVQTRGGCWVVVVVVVVAATCEEQIRNREETLLCNAYNSGDGGYQQIKIRGAQERMGRNTPSELKHSRKLLVVGCGSGGAGEETRGGEKSYTTFRNSTSGASWPS